MIQSSRRHFLQRVGNGMLIAGLGSPLALELGVAQESDLRPAAENDYGELTPWVRHMQELNPDDLQIEMVSALQSQSTSLQHLVAAAALANAETFGGQDYVGYHAEMALVPALEMSRELPKPRQPLPVLKVLYRNSSRIQQVGPGKKTLPAVSADPTGNRASVDVFRSAASPTGSPSRHGPRGATVCGRIPK